MDEYDPFDDCIARYNNLYTLKESINQLHL